MLVGTLGFSIACQRWTRRLAQGWVCLEFLVGSMALPDLLEAGPAMTNVAVAQFSAQRGNVAPRVPTEPLTRWFAEKLEELSHLTVQYTAVEAASSLVNRGFHAMVSGEYRWEDNLSLTVTYKIVNLAKDFVIVDRKVERGSIRNVQATLLTDVEGIFCEVRLDSDIPRASLLVDGQPAAFPFHRWLLKGPYDITVEVPGFRSFVKRYVWTQPRASIKYVRIPPR